jgi:hypothetical protein
MRRHSGGCVERAEEMTAAVPGGRRKLLKSESPSRRLSMSSWKRDNCVFCLSPWRRTNAHAFAHPRAGTVPSGRVSASRCTRPSTRHPTPPPQQQIQDVCNRVISEAVTFAKRRRTFSLQFVANPRDGCLLERAIQQIAALSRATRLEPPFRQDREVAEGFAPWHKGIIGRLELASPCR